MKATLWLLPALVALFSVTNNVSAQQYDNTRLLQVRTKKLNCWCYFTPILCIIVLRKRPFVVTIYPVARARLGWSGFIFIDDIRLSWMNIVSIGWISSALDDYRPRQISIIHFSWILSALDEYHSRQMSIICFSWISSAGDKYHATYLTILHNRWYSTARDDNQQLIGRHRWYIVCSR
jgi:hypothetical protein